MKFIVSLETNGNFQVQSFNGKYEAMMTFNDLRSRILDTKIQGKFSLRLIELKSYITFKMIWKIIPIPILDDEEKVIREIRN